MLAVQVTLRGNRCPETEVPTIGRLELVGTIDVDEGRRYLGPTGFDVVKKR